MKRILALFLAVLMLFPFTGCTPPAGNVNPELFVVASHSLLGVLGRDREGVLIIDEDDFGRVMFAYAGNTITSNRPGAMYNILAVAIVQRTTRQHSYFYDGINIIFLEIDVDCGPSALDFLDKDFVLERFSEEQLEQLKEENDWNEEIKEDRFFRVRVARGDKTRHMTSVSEEAKRGAFEEAFGEAFEEATFGSVFFLRSSIPLTTDQDGNVLFLISAVRTFLLMFDSDGTLIEETGIMELYDLWNYRDQLREFKEANGWAFYYQEAEED